MYTGTLLGSAKVVQTIHTLPYLKSCKLTLTSHYL
jgi:hypothetical protein